jgi:hypothetical protein
MKKIISLALVAVLVFGLAAISFADKPEWAGNKNQENQYEYKHSEESEGLPYGLYKKEVLPYGLSKRESLPFGLLRMQFGEAVTIEEIEILIADIKEYIEDIDEELIEEFTIIDAINNLFDKVEYELVNKEAELNDSFYRLTKKFEILKKQVEKVSELEEIDYNDELNKIKEDLETLLEDEDILTEDEELINTLITDIESLLLEEEITEEEYEAIVEDAEEFLENLDEETADLAELIKEIRLFIVNNDFSEEGNDYSAEESELIMLKLMDYSVNGVEDEAIFYEELLNDFESFKLSEIVEGSYITKVEDYKVLLDLLLRENLTDVENVKLDILLELVNEVIEDGKMTLKEFNSIEDQTSEFILNIDYYEVELDNLISEARKLIVNNPIDLNNEELLNARMAFLESLINGLSLRRDAETVDDYQEAIDFLQDGIFDFQIELDK